MFTRMYKSINVLIMEFPFESAPNSSIQLYLQVLIVLGIIYNLNRYINLWELGEPADYEVRKQECSFWELQRSSLDVLRFVP